MNASVGAEHLRADDSSVFRPLCTAFTSKVEGMLVAW